MRSTESSLPPARLMDIFLFDIAADEEELVNDPLVWLLDLSLESKRRPFRGERGDPSPSSPLRGCEIFLLCEVSSPSIFPTTPDNQINHQTSLLLSKLRAVLRGPRGTRQFPPSGKRTNTKRSTHSKLDTVIRGVFPVPHQPPECRDPVRSPPCTVQTGRRILYLALFSCLFFFSFLFFYVFCRGR